MSRESRPVIPPESGGPQEERRWTKEAIAKGVDFARTQQRRGVLSPSAVNAIERAQERLQQGDSTEADHEMLTAWADRAKWEEMGEQSRAEMRRVVVAEMGSEALESIERSLTNLDLAAKMHVFHVHGGNSAEGQEALALWREFSNNAHTDNTDDIKHNARKARRVTDGLRAANLLMKVEPAHGDADQAKEVIALIKQRFGIRD